MNQVNLDFQLLAVTQMSKTQADIGQLSLIQVQDNGTINQIGLTRDQHELLQLFVASISKDRPLARMGPEYNLKLARH